MRVPVLRVGAPHAPAPHLDLAPAAAWLSAQSGGRFALQPFPLADQGLGELARFRGAGGLEPHPHGSQGLVAEALAQLGPAARTLINPDSALIVVVPPGFRPHCWHLAGPARWQPGAPRRYAILPVGAPLGAILHELGHLLLDWPDLERDTGLGDECLMARGALLPRPAPPCAVLRLRAGWLVPRPVDRSTRVGDLEVGAAARVGGRVLERRRDPDRLLVLLDQPRPLLLQRILLAPGDGARPLLAVARFGPTCET